MFCRLFDTRLYLKPLILPHLFLTNGKCYKMPLQKFITNHVLNDFLSQVLIGKGYEKLSSINTPTKLNAWKVTTRKYLCLSFFFSRVASWGHAASIKRGSGTGFAQFLRTTTCWASPKCCFCLGFFCHSTFDLSSLSVESFIHLRSFNKDHSFSKFINVNQSRKH